MIQRIVCFKFKKEASDSQKVKHMNDFKKLKDAISQIITYSAGVTMEGDFDAAPDYDVMHYLTFNNKKDIDVYFHHEVHQEFIKNHKVIWENVLVVNSVITD